LSRAVPRIHDHAAIGDGRSVALVARDATITWLCWPRFESPAVLAAILDPERGGSWSITPTAPSTSTRRYLPDTNVLETRLETADGAVTITDAMIIDGSPTPPDHELIRIVRCERGRVELDVEFAPRPRFGRDAPHLRDARALGIRCELGNELLTLRASMPLTATRDRATARFVLGRGDTAIFSLTFDSNGPAVLPPLELAAGRVDATAAAWRRWAARHTYRGDYRDAVTRSLLTLKLLHFAPSGAVIAAPTTSLPEVVGGPLNWDYRFCWLRDASFTARALIGAGFPEDADVFCTWLLHTTRLTRPELGVLYDVYGNVPDDEELRLDLAGYRGSRPVRLRNGAARQLQLDSYGEVIDAATQGVQEGRHLDRATIRMLTDFGRFVAEHWREPDQGIWELRGGPRHHTHSKVLCWVALDRLIRLGIEDRGWAAARAAIRHDVIARGFDPFLGSYTESYGNGLVDASLLLLAWYGFEDAASRRMQGTYARVVERLGAGRGLFWRAEELRRSGEACFGIASFWVADFLARGGGSLAEARAAFEAAMAHANDVGLFGEEIDPRTGEALGNFPQAYTHVGVVDAALSIAERARGEAVEPPGKASA
jgi:GH15 family glucan-1,4-alpha-glucosidase